VIYPAGPQKQGSNDGHKAVVQSLDRGMGSAAFNGTRLMQREVAGIRLFAQVPHTKWFPLHSIRSLQVVAVPH